MLHELKTWPSFFQAICDGDKRFEVRRSDRNFQTGDRLLLREYDPEQFAYTGREATVKVVSCHDLRPLFEAVGMDIAMHGTNDKRLLGHRTPEGA